MAKKQHRFSFFYLFLTIWIGVFLLATALGLRWFWGYMASYENSRPHIATNAYMEKLTVSHICDQALPALLPQIDSSIQSEQQAREALESALQKELSCTKRTKQDRDDALVYVLRCGPQVIGSVTLATGEADDYGFAPWYVQEERFDLSYLLQAGDEVTVPSDATVTVGGNVLGNSHVLEANIQYDALSDFYASYTLPTRTHYQWGTHLGEVSVTVTDAAGNTIDPDTAPDDFLNNCTASEKEALDAISRDFVTAYIHFTSQTGGKTSQNLAQARKFVVPGGNLEKRLKATVSGLYWVTDRHVSIESITVSRYTNIGDGRYMCIVTYVVNTQDHTGAVRLENSEQIIFCQTENGLRAEAMIEKSA